MSWNWLTSGSCENNRVFFDLLIPSQGGGVKKGATIECRMRTNQHLEMVVSEVMAACHEIGLGVARCPHLNGNGTHGKEPEEEALLMVYRLPRRWPRRKAAGGFLPCFISLSREGEDVVIHLFPSPWRVGRIRLGLPALRPELVAVLTDWLLSQQVVEHALEV